MFMSPSSYLCAQGVAENNQFFDWKESDYKAYEDFFKQETAYEMPK